VDNRYIPLAKYSPTTSQPLIKLAALTKVASPESLSGQSKGGSVRKSKPHKCEHRTNVRRHFAVKPRLHPHRGPFVLNSWNKLHPATLITSRVEVHTAKLLEHHTLITSHFFRLIVQLVELHETIAGGQIAEAQHRLKILGQLSKSVGGQLVELHPKHV
jgi:hypothetical protein